MHKYDSAQPKQDTSAVFNDENRNKLEAWRDQLEILFLNLDQFVSNLHSRLSLNAAVFWAMLTVHETYIMLFRPDAAVEMTYLSSVTMTHSEPWHGFLSPIHNLSSKTEVVNEYQHYIFHEQLRMSDHSAFRNTQLARDTYILLGIADHLFTELAQSLVRIPGPARYTLAEHVTKWHHWKCQFLLFFSYLIVTQDYGQGRVVEAAARVYFYVTSQLKYLDVTRVSLSPLRYRIEPHQVHDYQIQNCVAWFRKRIGTSPRSATVTEFQKMIFNCHFPILLREAYLYRFPKQSRTVDSFGIADSVFISEYMEFFQRDLTECKKKNDQNPLTPILEDEKMPSHDLLLFSEFARAFNDHRTDVNWLNEAVILPVDWALKHTQLKIKTYDKDLDLAGRPMRPWIVNILGKWCVWTYLDQHWMVYECGRPIVACLQWLYLVKTRFDSRLIDGLTVPKEILALLDPILKA